MKTLSALFLCFILSLTYVSLSAQISSPNQREYGDVRDPKDFTDEEIQQFGEILQSVEIIQTEYKEKVNKYLNNMGIDMDSYQRIVSRLRGEGEDRPNDEEMERIRLINEQMQEMQAQVGRDVRKTVEDSGMPIREYQDKLKAYQSNDEFREKVEATRK